MPSASWANGWLSGDIVSAAEFAKGAGSIFDSTLGSDAASVDIPSIIGNYAHLMAVVYARTSSTNNQDQLAVRFNGTTTGYQRQRIQGVASSPTALEGISSTSIAAGNVPGVTTGAWGMSLILIPHYANGTNNKGLIALNFAAHNNSTGTQAMIVDGGWSTVTAAITQVTFFSSAGNLKAGSRVTLYALGA